MLIEKSDKDAKADGADKRTRAKQTAHQEGCGGADRIRKYPAPKIGKSIFFRQQDRKDVVWRNPKIGGLV